MSWWHRHTSSKFLFIYLFILLQPMVHGQQELDYIDICISYSLCRDITEMVTKYYFQTYNARKGFHSSSRNLPFSRKIIIRSKKYSPTSYTEGPHKFRILH